MVGLRTWSFILGLVSEVIAHDTWCGKYYEPDAPRTPPDPSTYFTHPPRSPHPLLDFRCTTASSIYLPGDDTLDPPAVIIDVNVTRDAGEAFDAHSSADLQVIVFLDGIPLTLPTSVPVPSVGKLLPFAIPLAALIPSTTPRTLRCKASRGAETFEITTDLLYLPPNPNHGSTVKLDRRSGGLLARREDDSGRGGQWEKLLPFGWYDSIDTDRAAASRPSPSIRPTPPTGDVHIPQHGSRDLDNFARLDLAKSLGFNMIHPVPPSTSYAPSGDPAAIKAYLDYAAELGIWVMYDFRHAVTHPKLVEEQLLQFRNHPAILTWYLSDEPDGPSLLPSLISSVSALAKSLDPYHPTSLVLNCNDYLFAPYTQSIDILLVDVYHIALNPLFSKKWSTPVTATFGCSGCDGCGGHFGDVTRRVDEWRERARVMGRGRDMPLWVVPQGFDDHGDEFWFRVPEGNELAVQVVLAFNHGVVGHCAWMAAGSTPDLLRNASALARHFMSHTHFLLDGASTRRPVRTTAPPAAAPGLDVAAWTIPLPPSLDATGKWTRRSQTLVLAAQTFYIPKEAAVEFGLVGVEGRVKQVLFGDVSDRIDGVRFSMGRISIAGVILEHEEEEKKADGPLDRQARDPLQIPLVLPPS